MSDDLTIAIPTINSSRYLDIILAFYRDNRIPVTVFVHDQSTDDTLAVAERLVPSVPISNPGHFVAEGLIEKISQRCRTKWILRMDDDELPSLAMMKFVQKAISEEQAIVYGFSRNQCIVSRSGRLLDCTEISPLEHRQWRLYQPAKMKYIYGVHTPGFEWDGGREEGQAPIEANMIHLDWALHTYEDRKRKIESYDLHTPDQGTRWRGYYLYEEQSYPRAAFRNLPAPEFQKPSVAISERFPDLCVGD